MRHTQRLLRNLLILLLAQPCLAMDLSEAQIKAGFLYNFAKYTVWPYPAAGERTLCVVGDHLPGTVLAELDTLPLNDSILRARSLTRPEEAKDCHVLFIGYNERSRLGSWLASVQSLPVLTVSDIAWSGRPRTMINLYLERRRLRYDVNYLQVREAGLKLNTRLTELADTVYDY